MPHAHEFREEMSLDMVLCIFYELYLPALKDSSCYKVLI